MISLNHDLVEKEIVKTIDEIKNKLKINTDINGECSPGNIEGLTSQILITIMGRIGNRLGVIIPDNCYIFHDQKTQRQLTINEAAQKLIKFAKNGK